MSEDGKISLDTEEYLAEIKETNVKVIKDTEPDNWPVTKEEIVKALTEIGLTRADNVMVHASLSKLGYGMWRGTDCYRGDYGNGGR